MDELHISEAIDAIFDVLRKCNKYIDDTTPWILAKDESKRARLASVMYNLCERIRIVSIFLQPYLTKTPEKIFAKLGIQDESLKTLDSAKFGKMQAGLKVEKFEIRKGMRMHCVVRKPMGKAIGNER